MERKIIKKAVKEAVNEVKDEVTKVSLESIDNKLNKIAKLLNLLVENEVGVSTNDFLREAPIEIGRDVSIENYTLPKPNIVHNTDDVLNTKHVIAIP